MIVFTLARRASKNTLEMELHVDFLNRVQGNKIESSTQAGVLFA